MKHFFLLCMLTHTIMIHCDQHESQKNSIIHIKSNGTLDQITALVKKYALGNNNIYSNAHAMHQRIDGYVGTLPAQVCLLIEQINQVLPRKQRIVALEKLFHKHQINIPEDVLDIIVQNTEGYTQKSLKMVAERFQEAHVLSTSVRNASLADLSESEIIATIQSAGQRPEPYINALILHGPPGTGKTLLAKKIAEITDSHFMGHLSGSNIVGTFQGEASKNLRELFESAIKHYQQTGQRVVIFIDEIDAIALALNYKSPARAEHQVATQELWQQLSNNKENPGIFFICATNHLDQIDLTFKNRFGGNIVKIPNPDALTRRDVLLYYFAKYNIEIDDTIVQKLVAKTDGLGIRSIEHLVMGVAGAISMHRLKNPTEAVIWDTLNEIVQKQTPAKGPWVSNETLTKWYTITGLTLNVHHLGSIAHGWYEKKRHYASEWFNFFRG